jgi:hypothetical protein
MHPLRADLDALRAFGNLRVSDGFDGFDVRTSRHWFLIALSRSGEGHLHAGDRHAALYLGSSRCALDRYPRGVTGQVAHPIHSICQGYGGPGET